MKKLISIILVVVSVGGVFGQAGSKLSGNQDSKYIPLIEFKGDTLKYVRYNFIKNKQKYIGKDLNTLLKDVEIPIKSYMNTDSFIDPTIMVGVILNFYSFKEASLRKEGPNKPVNIIIRWSPPLPRNIVDNLFKISKTEWTEAVSKYFGKQIIGDIFTTNWDK